MQIDLDFIREICELRPTANHSLEQYLMTPESILRQLEASASHFQDQKVLFIGDDDHLSLFYSFFFNVYAVVIEIDERIIESLKQWEKLLNLSNYKIVKHDVRDRLSSNHPEFNQLFDLFYCNPPYGSKNKAFGAKVWISRGLELLKAKGKGVVVLPIDFKLKWSLLNLHEVQSFILKNRTFIYRIDNNLHTYADLPDPNLYSSSFWLNYLGKARCLLADIPPEKNLYR